MKTIIVSDLHLGNRHCRAAAFLAFLAALPDDATLVLNGDTLDRHRALRDEHARALDEIAMRSLRAPVVWLPGNHDAGYRPPLPRQIRFQDDYIIPGRLYVAHGHTLDDIMPAVRPLLNVLRTLHDFLGRLGVHGEHVAAYAKRAPRLYRVLCGHLRRRAMEAARVRGLPAVTCGHTHFVEDCVENGVRYINTGAWTEDPQQYIEVTDSTIRLLPFAAECA